MSEEIKDKKRQWGSFLINLIGFLVLLGTTVGTLWFAHERYLESPPEGSAAWGDFIGGFGGWLAFLWLIYSIHLQRADIKAQLSQREDDHEEIELQRKAIQGQLDHMRILLERAILENLSKTVSTAESELRRSISFQHPDAWESILYPASKSIFTDRLDWSSIAGHCNAILHNHREFRTFLETLNAAFIRYEHDMETLTSNKTECLYQKILERIHLLYLLPETARYREQLLSCVQMLKSTDIHRKYGAIAAWIAIMQGRIEDPYILSMHKYHIAKNFSLWKPFPIEMEKWIREVASLHMEEIDSRGDTATEPWVVPIYY